MNKSFTFLIILISFLNLLHEYNCKSLDINSFIEKRKKKPAIVQEKTYCQSCITIIVNAMKELSGKKSEFEIDYVLTELFDNKNKLSKYTYIYFI